MDDKLAALFAALESGRVVGVTTARPVAAGGGGLHLCGDPPAGGVTVYAVTVRDEPQPTEPAE